MQGNNAIVAVQLHEHVTEFIMYMIHIMLK